MLGKLQSVVAYRAWSANLGYNFFLLAQMVASDRAKQTDDYWLARLELEGVVHSLVALIKLASPRSEVRRS